MHVEPLAAVRTARSESRLAEEDAMHISPRTSALLARVGMPFLSMLQERRHLAIAVLCTA